MKTTVKGMNRKQIITMLEGRIRNDNMCITEGDMCALFSEYADEYEIDLEHEERGLTLTKINNYWSPLRLFLPRLGDTLKGFSLYEPKKAGEKKHSEAE